MIDLHPPKYKSTNVLLIGFEGTGRGNVHIQFHDGTGRPTTRGYYKDVQAALYNSLNGSRAPSRFVSENLKPHFEWVRAVEDEAPEIAECRAHPDLTLPNEIVVPSTIPKTVDAIESTINSQRIPVDRGLFE